MTTEDQKVVLITGAGSGIGLQTAAELAHRGCRVFASLRNLAAAPKLMAKAASIGVKVSVVELDVTKTASVNAAVEKVLATAGRIDVVVNNAAVGTVGPLEFATEDEITSTFDTNVIGPIRLIRAVLPSMRARKAGLIVNVSSGSAHTRTGVRLLSLYASSKAALHTLTLDLNKELAHLGIRTILVEAGVGGRSGIVTRMADRSEKHDPASPYAVVEKMVASQMRAMMRGLSDGSDTAKMIADACTTPNPALRFPPELQQPLDMADRLPDTDFLKLCAMEDYDNVIRKNRLEQSGWRVVDSDAK